MDPRRWSPDAWQRELGRLADASKSRKSGGSGGNGGGKGSSLGGFIILTVLATAIFPGEEESDLNRPSGTHNNVTIVEPLSYVATDITHEIFYPSEETRDHIAVAYTDAGRFFISLGDDESSLRQSVNYVCNTFFSDETCNPTEIFNRNNLSNFTVIRRNPGDRFCIGVGLYRLKIGGLREALTGETINLGFAVTHINAVSAGHDEIEESLHQRHYAQVSIRQDHYPIDIDVGKIAVCNYPRPNSL